MAIVVGGEVFFTLRLFVHSSSVFFLHMLGQVTSDKYILLHGYGEISRVNYKVLARVP